MAVRFDANNEWYQRTLTLGTTTQFSVTCWCKLVVDRNAFSGVWALDNTSGSDSYLMGTANDGTTIDVVDEDGPNTSGFTTALNTWFYYGVSINGASGRATRRNDTTATFTTQTWSGGDPSTSITRLRIGADTFSDWMNGSVCAVKIWTAALSQAELEAEALAFAPVRSSNIYAWYPFHAGPETADYGPNGLTLSGGSGTASDTNPNTPALPSAPSAGFTGWGVPI